jgi:hypothetical protein
VSTRVVFLRAGAVSAVPLGELGRIAAGAWGLVDDRTWLAAGLLDEIELLYLSQAEYLHAVRGLAPDKIGEAVLHRRRAFSPDVPAQALGEVAQRASACLRQGAEGAPADGARVDLLTALATFTTVPRLARAAPLVLLDYLREGDAEIMAELESPSLRAAGEFDRSGVERETRRSFIVELGQIAARRGQPSKAQTLPYFDVERTYFVVPADPAIERRAGMLNDPMRPWRDGIVVSIPERIALDVQERGHTLKVLFPAPGPFARALVSCTPAQLDVELGERMTAPGFAAYLNARRLHQATLRAAVHLIAGAAAEIAPVLERQTREEAARLGTWLAPDMSQAAIPMAEALVAVIDTATLLAALCRHHDRLAIAAKVEALAHALSYVAQEVRH